MGEIARPHVPEEELHAFCDGELSPAQRVEIAEHLLGCLICRSQHGEVDALRARASELLSLATPRSMGDPARTTGRRIAAPSRAPRFMVAAAVAAIGVGVWFSVLPIDGEGARAQLATSLGLTGFFRLGGGEMDVAAARGRQITIAARTTVGPQVQARTNAAPFMAAPAIVTTEVDPVAASEWTSASFDEALKEANGTLARVSDLPVKLVRVHPSAGGGRPTFMIRQQLADGHAVWVFEGLEGDIAPLDQLLQASGISMSMATRTRPDYVNSGVQTAITVRMVRVVGYLSTDSLNALAQKLVLR